MAKKLYSTSRNKTAVAVFKAAGTDSSGVSNATVASHGTGVFIPSGAVITNAYYVVGDTFTSATDAATIALSVQSAGDLKAAIAISDGTNVWDAGTRGCLPGSYALDGNALTAIAGAAAKAASYIVTTAEREITVTIGVEALAPTTNGEMVIYVEYVV